MTTLLTTKKRLLTTYVNKLDHILNSLKNEKLEDTPWDPSLPQEIQIDNIHRLEEGVSVMELAIDKVERALQEFASLLDTNSLLATDQSDFESYTGKSENILTAAFDYLLVVQARLRALKCAITAPVSNPAPLGECSPNASLGQAKVKTLDLPPIPVPTFGGNIWEWDNFWGIFNTNIHSQDLSNMVKYNYLLNALRGEPRESIRKFQVTGENYTKAIQFLHNKYNNKEALVQVLVEKLDNCTLRGPSVKDQRQLLEQLQMITTQLEEKGEEINSSWLIKKVLGKFPDSVKRKTIAKKQGQGLSSPFTMSLLFQYIDEILSTEEMILMYSQAKVPTSSKPNTFFNNRSARFKGTCMYCNGNHLSHSCTKYTTPQERSLYLRKNNLCLICASSRHSTTQCRGRMCFNCGGPHHTSCCFKTVSNTASNSATKVADIPKKGTTKKPTTIAPSKKDHGPDSKISTTKVRSHVVTVPSEVKSPTSPTTTLAETAILQQQSLPSKSSLAHPCLPIGELTVMDQAKKTLEKVSVLLDTGAELSFVDSAIAERLQLPVLEVKEVLLHTFGSDSVKKRKCNRVCLEVWDSEGTPHNLDLLTHDVLTRSLATPKLPHDDIEFIRSLDLPIAWRKTQGSVTPSILLGCDQLWSFVRNDKPAIVLPSGMHILPTKLGYLISGKAQPQKGYVAQVSQSLNDEINNWEGRWSMDMVGHYAIRSEDDTISQEEREQWDKFWTLDAAGTEEFSGTEKAARAEQDKKVWQHLTDTIERRSDGYYVRLPWKEKYPFLPDNKALAYRRLVNVWSAISKDDQLLDQYNGVFQDQLRQNIIEEVDETITHQGNQIHYIPHQPVITPHKTTTKLRVVFDASAHYKGCPSLNDVLHRGPVILPLIYGILLRFRMGRIAIISDVEKAFLQIRLQETDRDATRCFWLRDHKSPPSLNNTVTFRFTRVTFGLKSSPFLLAGATHYHLDRYENESKLIQDIKRNLYVDNLLLTTDTIEDAIGIYHQTKQIFQDLNMNLREFSSNDSHLMETINETDKTSDTSPKVLGLLWDVKEDTILVSIYLPDTPLVTKRTVTSAIASIYDPLGWAIPLLHRAKIFLQELWKEQYQWDTILPKENEDEWNNIVETVQGFQKALPRYLMPKHDRAILVTFADASSSAMAACTYLCYCNRSTLIMAKSKLPSLQGQYTIPKLELNAMTLAIRLSNSVFSELKETITITDIYLFSDSEIVLSWLKLTPEREVGPFVYNRLVEIRNIAYHITNQQCEVMIGYVSSQENPADCGTRGLIKEEAETHLWWSGPEFLQSPPTCWPNQSKIFTYPLGDQEEMTRPQEPSPRQVFTVKLRYLDDSELLRPSQVRTFTQAKRYIAYVLRFIFGVINRINRKGNNQILLSLLSNQRPEQETESLCLTGSEIRQAGKVLIRHHQTTYVTPHILHSLQQLNIRHDERGLLRCYGRLGQAELDYDAKNPIFVLQKTLLADIIIRDFHLQGHPGINHTIALVRQEFWIPQLRSQVSSLIRKCIKCQKFNNLPYKYPTQEDLPKERVLRSYPFQHVGLDYFGPLSIATLSGAPEKAYGAILTCMTTRLVHLDVVSDLSTIAFLHMLRRFFARRGVPRSITSDNAPTFELGEAILNESIRAVRSDPSVARALSNREIEWRHITPFAPWQGGFYERLIKSVKHSLYKTLGRSTLPFEELTTTLIEIEALLNTRPLTYITSEPHKDLVLRPIDFLQKELVVFHPIGQGREEIDDPQYFPSKDLMVLQTKQQAIKALETSCQLTEKFWTIWQTQYLTALREKHTLQVTRKKGCAQPPSEGTLVLISDPILPRHSWKMGTIDQVIANPRGTIREAVVRLPSQRLIRRPVNLLIPLELDDDSAQRAEHSEQSPNRQGDAPEYRPPAAQKETGAIADQLELQPHARYNLRKRRHVDYSEEEDLDTTSPGSSRSLFSIAALLQITIVLLLSCFVGTTTSEQPKASIRLMQCIPGGVHLVSPDQMPYEICAEHYCVQLETPQLNETIALPPEIVLHEHRVRWKYSEETSVNTIETTCPPSPFCQSIRCTFCSANILNPECWPKHAIFATAILLYCFITGCYVFLYVPLVLGKPLRVAGRILWAIVRYAIRHCWRLKRSTNRGQFSRRRIAEIIAIVFLIPLTQQCQQINLFTHYSTICTKGSEMTCQVQVSEVFKINPFKREACLRLSQNNTAVHEIHLQWNSLVLTCEPITDLFTRDTVHKVIDSKRCPHSGSCVGTKCGSINASSLIPELAIGNQYPGNTACVESCGGLGCDCFYPSSGCLFYRIYLVPVSDDIFELFHCNRWTEAAKIQVTHLDRLKKTSNTVTKFLLPNVPVKWGTFTITLSSIGIPPLPLLNTPFISNNKTTALWKPNMMPALRCSNLTNARNLACEVFDDCVCLPAETKANCKCKNFPIGKWFRSLSNQLPAIFPSISFQQDPLKKVQAIVSGMVTSEIILSFQDTLRTEILVDDAICKIQAGEITGCYNCAKGGNAHVLCISSLDNMQAEVVCGSTTFTLPCNTTGIESTLRFSLSQARIHLLCTVSCGKITSSFELGGILKFTGSAQGLIEQWLEGESMTFASLSWPDFFHIYTIFFQWYKTLAVAIVTVLIMVAVTYVFLSTYGVKLLSKFVIFIFKSVLGTITFLAQSICLVYSRLVSVTHRKQH